MKKEDFILQAASWFFFDNIEESLKLVTEADKYERHIKDVYYKHFCQDMSAEQLREMIHNLAYEYFMSYRKGFLDCELIVKEKIIDGEKQEETNDN